MTSQRRRSEWVDEAEPFLPQHEEGEVALDENTAHVSTVTVHLHRILVAHAELAVHSPKDGILVDGALFLLGIRLSLNVLFFLDV